MKSFDEAEDEEKIVYDYASLEIYTRVDEEVDEDAEMDFSLVPRPENLEELNEEHFTVSLFYFLFFLFILHLLMYILLFDYFV